MQVPFQLIQVFSSEHYNFHGNTSAVALLEHPLSDREMQRIAADFNQPATTFLWPHEESGSWNVRWFAPDAEIGLCGHGSLAAIAMLADHSENIKLVPRKGASILGGFINTEAAYMLLSPIESKQDDIPDVLESGLGFRPKAYFINNNKHIALFESEDIIQNIQPKFEVLRKSRTFGYIITAPGNEVDFVSRTLVPHVQQLEDPATGSSHAALAPFWAKRLNKSDLIGHQLSSRGGRFECSVNDNEVKLTGEFKLIAKGDISV